MKSRATKPLAICLLLVSHATFAQQKPTSAQPKPAKLAFEVAAVRATDPNDNILVGMSSDPSIVRYDNITLRDAIRGAFRTRDFQIVAPDWMASAKFQIEGKLPEGARPDQAPDMLQTLLEDRFKLETKREMKEMNVYALVVAKEGFKMKPSQLVNDSTTQTAMGTDGKPRRVVFFGGSATAVTVTAPGSSMLTFVGVTTRFTQWPLVDLTGIDGLYDFEVRFAPEVTSIFGQPNPDAPPGDPAPTLTDALKAYGLRLEKRKMPIEMLVVTHMERTPTDN